jgi:hypothetical protein
MKLSAHAHERIIGRLSTLVTLNEVTSKIEKVSARLTDHRNFVLIKKMKYIEIRDMDVKPDGVARGDMVIALVENGIIETIMLRKSWSINGSSEFRKLIH